MVRTVTLILASLTAFGQILLLGGIVLAIAGRMRLKAVSKAYAFLHKHALPLMFAVSLTATLGSLFFSEIAHYPPCTLCWYQRILMYPQAMMLGLDLARSKRNVLPYSFLLSAVGLPIALYHYFLQLFPAKTIFCEAGGVDCARRVSFTFGYISIPLMAATAFALLLLLVYFAGRRNRP